MDNKPEMVGFVMAGGKSSRLGRDKALLKIQDKTLLQRMIELINPFCETVSISGQNAQYEVFGVEMIPDLHPDCGPISGLYSCLRSSAKEWNLFISVDVPFVNHELITLLISNISNQNCIVPQHQGGIEPLIGLYNKRAIPAIEKMIEAGEYKLMNLLSTQNTDFIDCNSLIKNYPRLFMNINRIEDFRSI
jgi:molybdopterin-guanine dinucleotide biosynthesis protein A